MRVKCAVQAGCCSSSQDGSHTALKPHDGSRRVISRREFGRHRDSGVGMGRGKHPFTRLSISRQPHQPSLG